MGRLDPLLPHFDPTIIHLTLTHLVRPAPHFDLSVPTAQPHFDPPVPIIPRFDSPVTKTPLLSAVPTLLLWPTWTHYPAWPTWTHQPPLTRSTGAISPLLPTCTPVPNFDPVSPATTLWPTCLHHLTLTHLYIYYPNFVWWIYVHMFPHPVLYPNLKMVQEWILLPVNDSVSALWFA
jgi:hypothetical protein